jgi:hypothetical protein
VQLIARERLHPDPAYRTCHGCGRGKSRGQLWRATSAPSWSKIMQRVLVVLGMAPAEHNPVVEPAGGLVAVAATVDGAQLLSGNPAGSDVATLVAGVDAGQHPCPPGVGEVFSATAQHPSYPVERVIGEQNA